MDILIFGTQIGLILTYIGGLFYIYRVLVSQKDATIETQKERIGFLEEQLKAAKQESPDVVAERLSRRVQIAETELGRLSSDDENNRDHIAKLEAERDKAREEAEDFQHKLDQAKEVFEELTCPHCGSIIVERFYPSQTMWSDEYGDMEVDYEVVRYACGFETTDGNVDHPCPQQKSAAKSIKGQS